MTAGDSSAQEHQPGAGAGLRLALAAPEDGMGRPVYIAGNFNGWRTSDEAYRMQEVAPGQFAFEFPAAELLPEVLEYKYHRGGWEHVEIDRFGNAIPNRQWKSSEKPGPEDRVERWMIDGLYYNPAFLPKIVDLSADFKVPKLIKTRRITALLPHDYDTSGKRYPVLYLQDGQNLFDEYAPFGNWGVNKRLAMMAEQGFGDIIVIAIDHAEKDRIAEYTPSFRTQLGSGNGKKYVRALADRLKPFVDEHFRTRPEREHTGIGGSSMGGLISIYGGLIYPEVYGKLMIFSPSLWVSPNIHFHYMNFFDPRDMRVYVYAGEGESANMVPNIRRFINASEQQTEASFTFELSLDPDGAHNEARWGQEFPRAVEWLFFQTTKD